MEILEFLKQENISDKIITEIKSFRSFYKLEAEDESSDLNFKIYYLF